MLLMEKFGLLSATATPFMRKLTVVVISRSPPMRRISTCARPKRVASSALLF